jgi:molybdopterin adenylyltransferase
MSRAVVMTVSDSLASGRRDQDESGDAVEELLKQAGFEQITRVAIADDIDSIKRELIRFRDAGVPLVVTAGGTGLGPRDVTPEATQEVVDRPAPGLAEAMRAEGLKKTPFAALSRGLAGAAQETLILNLPGSPKGAKESLEAVIDVIPHALRLLAGDTAHHKS